MSRRKKENKRKVRKTKDKRLKQRACHLLGNLTSIEVAGQIFGSIEENEQEQEQEQVAQVEQVAAILRAQSPGSTCRRGLNIAVESDDEAQEANEVVEWDDEAQDGADEAVESNLV